EIPKQLGIAGGRRAARREVRRTGPESAVARIVGYPIIWPRIAGIIGEFADKYSLIQKPLTAAVAIAGSHQLAARLLHNHVKRELGPGDCGPSAHPGAQDSRGNDRPYEPHHPLLRPRDDLPPRAAKAM